jgi:hypothetical protein
MSDMHERDIAATDEMIRNLKAGSFRKVATGVGIAGALLLAGASLLVWTYRQGNDPEVLKEALRNMPPLNVTVTLAPDSIVKLEQPAMVTLDKPVLPAVTTGNNNDPAIQTTVTVFKAVKYGAGEIITGWKFKNGAATQPYFQYCYYTQELVSGASAKQDIANDGVVKAPPPGVSDQKERLTNCQWFNGNV